MAYTIKQYGRKAPIFKEDFSAQALCPKGAISKTWPSYRAPLDAGVRPDLFTGVQDMMRGNSKNFKRAFKVTQL